jgi:hypothetical protein
MPAMDCPRSPQSISYVAFKILFAALDVAVGTGGHINADATLRTALSDWLHREAHGPADTGKRSRRSRRCSP